MPVFSLREKHVPVVPCMCPRCRAAVLELPDGERRWLQREAVAQRLQRTLRDRLRVCLADECEMAERRRPRRMELGGEP